MNYLCRACQSANLKGIVFLENMPLTDDFISIENQARKEYLKDINIFECQQCKLVQNPADFDHEGYYQDYQYSSGHSPFVQNFMLRYAEVVCEIYKKINGKLPGSVLEIGSGDGEQLKQFKLLSVRTVLGIEPSEYLAQVAIKSGIPTQVDLFGTNTKQLMNEKFDICLSSYTLDHVRSPIDYLEASYELLNDGGILTFEVHNLEKIIQRTEYCLFEHEHTIYLTPENAVNLVKSKGFEVVSIDPISNKDVRGNSLIIIAKKININSKINIKCSELNNRSLEIIDSRIKETIRKIDDWVINLPKNSKLVGFGAGGRGVMTLAALKNYSRFSALFDSNYHSQKYLTPKTRIPIVGPDRWTDFNEAYCLIFSFGYFDEIKNQLIAKGYKSEKIFSLSEFFPEIETFS